MKRPTTTRILTLSLLLSTTTTTTTYAADPSSSKRNNTADNNNSHNKEPKKVISLQESIEITQRNLQDPDYRRIREEYWKETFQEIKNLARGYPSSRTAAANKKNGTSGSSSGSSGSVLSQWKDFVEDDAKPTAHHATRDNVGDSYSTISDNSIPTEQRMDEDTDAEALKEARTSSSDSSSRQERPPRFEGFPSWDRLLQDWSEDIQEYLDQASEDSEAGYSFSNFGRAASASTTTTTTIVQKSSSLSETASSLSSSTVVGQQPQEGTTMAAPAPLPDDTTVPLALPELNKKIPIPAPAQPGEAVLPHTDISDKSKHLLIVTTASLPWKTGTAVNPLLRAAYLSQGRTPAGGSVTLLLPWLERREDQVRVYGADGAFGSPEDQEAYVRTWLRESANLNQESVDLKLAWYTAWQNKVENSIYSMGDITAAVSSEEVDICILEEPEHLNWYRAPGESWTKKYKHVVGILHTNYFSYALDQPAALIRAPAMKLLCAWMCRAHCHRVIKLSGTFDKFAPEKELVENVHGVRATFLDVGEHVKGLLQESSSHPIFGADAEPKIYFIGKMLWSKGLGSLMELLKYSEESANLKVSVDMYGGGPDAEAANKKAQKLKLDLPFCGPLDHAELALTHKVFVNPSTSEVLCTTSAEALAMGKFVIIPSHPSNDFFAQFPNCLPYATKEEFVGNLYYALTHEPEVLTDEYAFALSWEAATERLVSP